MTEPNVNPRPQQVGRKVIGNSIIGAFHHYVQAVQLEGVSLKDALGEAVKLCDSVKALFQEEYYNTK